jgi:alkanesulfonate monooxygenase SsuD/methylene tetrahydromethanopterin reductase-like flavin-dependent oxidoreductase (luciferase family)
MAGVTGVRQPRGTGFVLRDPLPWDGLARLTRLGEDLGYAALFLPEIVARDAFAALAALAGETRGLLLGTGVLAMRSRTPLLTAMGAATVQERSGGRLVLGLGTGSVGRGALDELRRTVADVRSLLRGERVERDGGRRALALLPGARVPVWISAMGPRAFRLAGEVADGALLNWCTPERVAFARTEIAKGAEAAGRDPGSVILAVYVRSWVGPDPGAALAVLKAAAGEYAGYPAYARVHAFTAFGDRAPERLAAYRAAGADLVLVYPVAVGDPAPSIEGTLRALTPGPS